MYYNSFLSSIMKIRKSKRIINQELKNIYLQKIKKGLSL